MNKMKIVGVGFCTLITLGIGIQKWLDLKGENERLHEELIGQTTKYQQLSEFSAKLEIQYKNQQDIMKKLEKDWASEKDNLQGRIKVLSNATFLIREKAQTSNTSDLVYVGNKMKYVVNEIRYNEGPPVGYVLIFDDGRVISKLYNHTIDVKTAVSREESTGKYVIISKADYILKSPSLNVNNQNWYNKPYPLKIIGGSASVDPSEPIVSAKKKLYFWTFNLNGNVHFYTNGVAPALSTALMGYGYSMRDLDWKFLDLGLGYVNSTKGITLDLTPVLYRPIPKILRNTYVGPGISLDSYGLKYFLGINIGL